LLQTTDTVFIDSTYCPVQLLCKSQTNLDSGMYSCNFNNQIASISQNKSNCCKYIKYSVTTH